MTHHLVAPPPTNAMSWQQVLAAGVADTSELLALLDLPQHLGCEAAHQQFALRVPRGFVARMRKGDPQDPLLRQVLPVVDEMQSHPLFSTDPLQEERSNPIPGLLHKYHGRVLITAAGACAINCRYCFRRHFSYRDNNPGSLGWQRILAYIAEDKNITEVILSGGDPLLLNDQQIQLRVEQLAAITHVKRLRIHSRLPIVLPERVTEALVTCLADTRLKTAMVIHCNHANEIDEPVATAIKRLSFPGIILLNQAVLLKGVNDDAEQLIRLCEALGELGVLPYYLHSLDKVTGTHHFMVELNKAKQLMRTISSKLPGYLLPKFVCELGGETSKRLIDY